MTYYRKEQISCCGEELYSLGASQSTQKLFPLTFRMD